MVTQPIAARWAGLMAMTSWPHALWEMPVSEIEITTYSVIHNNKLRTIPSQSFFAIYLSRWLSLVLGLSDEVRPVVSHYGGAKT